MLVADTYLGNVDDDADLAARVDRGEESLTVTVDETERRRSRFRTTAEDGTDLGVVVGRELRAGDVLAADGTLVRIALEPVAAMVIDLGDVDATTSALTTALALGHVVGNRHWDLAVEGDHAYLPMADSRDQMEAEVEPHLPDGASVGYDEVSPSLFDEDDGGQAHPHGHDHDAGHAHSHGPGDEHSHGDAGHSHTHAGDGHVPGVRDLDGGDSS